MKLQIDGRYFLRLRKKEVGISIVFVKMYLCVLTEFYVAVESGELVRKVNTQKDGAEASSSDAICTSPLPQESTEQSLSSNSTSRTSPPLDVILTVPPPSVD